MGRGISLFKFRKKKRLHKYRSIRIKTGLCKRQCFLVKQNINFRQTLIFSNDKALEMSCTCNIQQCTNSKGKYLDENYRPGSRGHVHLLTSSCLGVSSLLLSTGPVDKCAGSSLLTLDCLQSAFSLKIRLALISASAVANHDVQ